MHMAKRLSGVLGVVGLLFSQMAWADTTADVKTVFERAIVAQNARDTETLKGLLLDTPNFLWVARGKPVLGCDAALQSLDEQCHGTFYLDPAMAEFRTIELTGDVVQLYVPTVFMRSPPAQPRPPVQVPQMQPEKFIISQTMVKTSAGLAYRDDALFPSQCGAR
jgi:hypothetical protein